MLTWIILPPNFDPNKKYPTLLFCEGGPQSPVSQFWSYRWNFMIMASNGYVVVAPNRRGLPGFGQEWLEEISGDWTGQCMKDYLAAIDDAAENLPYVDKDKLGAVGASTISQVIMTSASRHLSLTMVLSISSRCTRIQRRYSSLTGNMTMLFGTRIRRLMPLAPMSTHPISL